MKMVRSFLVVMELILSSGEVLWKSDEIERSDDEEEESDGSDPPELVEYDEDDEDGGEDNSDDDEEEVEEEEDSDQEGWEDCSDASGEQENEDNSKGAMEEEEDPDEWVSCSEDEEGDDSEGDSPPELVSVSTEPRVRLDQRRILTAEDFSLLEKLKSAQKERLSDPRNRSKRKRLDDDDEEEEGSRHSQPYTVSEDQIAPEAKVKKATKIERLTRVLEGRVENRFVHEGHAGGLTNKEKQRKKNYVMIRKGKREVATKNRRSNSEVRWQKSKAVSFLSSSSSLLL